MPGLDHIRAGAAILIVFYHALHKLSFIPRAGPGFRNLWLYSTDPIKVLVEEGHTAVALFMVLSGFVFSVSAIGKDIAYLPFLRNRFLRIYPLYLVMLMAGVAAGPGQYNLLSFMQALLFQANLQGSFSQEPFTGMFWAVAVEFQFYLVFPFLHRFVEKDGVRWPLLFIVMMCVLRYAAMLTGSSNPQDIYYWQILGRIDQFLLGMLAARLYVRLPKGVLLSLLGLVLSLGFILGALIAYNQHGAWLSVGAWKTVWPTVEALGWAAVIVFYLPLAERLPARLSAVIATVGTWSYSMYMIHVVCIVALPKLIPVELGERPNWASQMYTLKYLLPVVLPLSALSFYAIERPFFALRVKYLLKREPETQD
jgi:peptidoglycan/LPS O-acetylase OafA/YrhL